MESEKMVKGGQKFREDALEIHPQGQGSDV